MILTYFKDAKNHQSKDSWQIKFAKQNVCNTFLMAPSLFFRPLAQHFDISALQNNLIKAIQRPNMPLPKITFKQSKAYLLPRRTWRFAWTETIRQASFLRKSLIYRLLSKIRKFIPGYHLKRGSLRNGAVAQRLSERQQAIAGLRSLQILTITGNITCRRQPPADTIKKQKMSGNAILYGKK